MIITGILLKIEKCHDKRIKDAVSRLNGDAAEFTRVTLTSIVVGRIQSVSSANRNRILVEYHSPSSFLNLKSHLSNSLTINNGELRKEMGPSS